MFMQIDVSSPDKATAVLVFFPARFLASPLSLIDFFPSNSPDSDLVQFFFPILGHHFQAVNEGVSQLWSHFDVFPPPSALHSTKPTTTEVTKRKQRTSRDCESERAPPRTRKDTPPRSSPAARHLVCAKAARRMRNRKLAVVGTTTVETLRWKVRSEVSRRRGWRNASGTQVTLPNVFRESSLSSRRKKE
jgi:hypothetical protein